MRAALLGVALLALGGLAACGPAELAQPEVKVIHVAAPMREPVWSDHAKALLGLTEQGSRVEKVDPDRHDRSSLSAALPDVGANVVAGLPSQSRAYVPQPGLGRVAVLDVPTLRQIGTLQVGPAPNYLATDVGASILLALSRNGTRVTGTDLRDSTVVATQRVHAGSDAALVGPARERLVEFHLTGPNGIVHYQDGEQLGRLPVPASDAAGDEWKVTRIYVAELDRDRVVALDSTRSQDGLEVVGHADLGAPVSYVGADDFFVYALAGSKLVVLNANSFEGFAGGTMSIKKTIDLRPHLPAALRGASPSGLAVGADRVYVSYAGQPYIVGVAKPSV